MSAIRVADVVVLAKRLGHSGADSLLPAAQMGRP
jgi:hypothetical protein